MQNAFTLAKHTRVPLPVQLDRNKFLGRWLIETLGYYPFSLAASRNNAERLEIGLDWGMWGVMGIVMPFLLDRFLSRRLSNRIRRQFNLAIPAGKAKLNQSLLNLPFEVLLKQHPVALPKAQLEQLAQNLQMGSASGLEAMLAKPAFRQAVLHSKFWILTIGLTMMAAKGQLYSWVKNWLTEKRSGKKGFSGEFNYTDQAYRDKKSEAYYRDKKKRMLISVGCGLMASIGFPLAVLGMAKGVPGLKRLKKLLPRFNYVDGIFMPNEVFLVHTLFNYNLPMLLSCRDEHEFREKLSRCLAFDFFFYLGDDLIAGKVARLLEKLWRLKQPVSQIKRGFLGFKFRHANTLESVYTQKVAQLGANYAKDPAYKAAWWSWLSGLSGTSLGLGLTIPVLNNIYTYKAVQQDLNTSATGTTSPAAITPNTQAFGAFTATL
jgi:hypothetical protein